MRVVFSPENATEMRQQQSDAAVISCQQLSAAGKAWLPLSDMEEFVIALHLRLRRSFHTVVFLFSEISESGKLSVTQAPVQQGSWLLF